ncbi:MAG TPA: hybrid sensor histidine kinase/response regulator, partial [Cyanobacteria bacterium UBA11049]|nr:hybrid sensor histidine kinase/response regulator [Cyanobacteria bacterium UBA11049]
AVEGLLLLDDNPDDRVLAIRQLQREFNNLQVEQIIEAKGFNRALAAGNFDLVITDYQMHWTDGISVLRAIKARYPDRPVIMFTNTGSQEIAVEAMKAGLEDYVLKSPKHYIRLPVAVRSALERTLNQRRAIHIENRLQFLLNRLDVGVFRTTQAGELIEGNAAFVRILQVNSLPEAQHIYLQQLYIRREIGSSTLQWERELQLQRNDGSKVWVLLSEALSTNDGEIAIDGLLEDISDRKSAEAELRLLNENLERRVRERTAELEAINKDLKAFSYSVSHDLREPLRAIEGFAQAMLEDFADSLPPLGQEYTQRIVAAAHRLDKLIQDILRYSRLSRADLQRSRVNLSAVVAEALTQLKVEIQQHQAQISVAEPLPEVIGDYTTLLSAIVNLLANAVKFVAPDVQPQVRVWAEETGGQGDLGTRGLGEFRIISPTTSKRVRLWIEDNGIGIAPKNQQQIFRVFERLHGVESYGGTGIGLAIVHKGIERMGGCVGVQSQLGQGSRFWLELRLVND